MSQESRFHVTGMSCENCVKHVTHAVARVPGVAQVKEVDLASGTLRVVHDGGAAVDQAIIQAVADEGYGAERER